MTDLTDSEKGIFRYVTIPEFVQAVHAGSIDAPPPVHSTTASSIFDIVRAGSLAAAECDVFAKEKLCYFFIGRPSYKKSGRSEVPYWMLPVVFILKGLDRLPIKRIYPLDTGAFASRRLPDYLTTFDLDGFALGSDPVVVRRVIATFYDTTERYMKGRNFEMETIKKRTQIDARHARIEALVKLYSERSLPEVDDRGRNIEVQVGEDVPLADNILGVVLPEEYRTVPELNSYFLRIGAKTEYYGLFPMSAESHFGLMYEAVLRIIGK